MIIQTRRREGQFESLLYEKSTEYCINCLVHICSHKGTSVLKIRHFTLTTRSSIKITALRVGETSRQCLGSGSLLRKSINSNTVINSTVGRVPRVNTFHFHHCRDFKKEIQNVIIKFKFVFCHLLGSLQSIANQCGSLLIYCR